MAKPKYTPQQVIEALKQTRGIKSLAAQALGCDRSTIENYIAKHPRVKAAYEEQRATLVDVAEGHLAIKLDNGEWDAVKYVLNTLGRDRGYGEERGRFNVNLTPAELQGMTDEELNTIRTQIATLIDTN